MRQGSDGSGANYRPGRSADRLVKALIGLFRTAIGVQKPGPGARALSPLVQLEGGLAGEAGWCNAMAEQLRVPRAPRPSRFVALPQSAPRSIACRPAEDALTGPAIVSEQVWPSATGFSACGEQEV